MAHPLAPRLRGSSPWGTIDSLQELGPDCVVVGTPSHGGIWVSPEALERIPAAARIGYAGAPWFEEDCDWAIPYALLHLHEHELEPARSETLRAAALQSLQQWHRDLHAELVEAGHLPRPDAEAPAAPAQGPGVPAAGAGA